jgi:hypothetical protein
VENGTGKIVRQVHNGINGTNTLFTGGVINGAFNEVSPFFDGRQGVRRVG